MGTRFRAYPVAMRFFAARIHITAARNASSAVTSPTNSGWLLIRARSNRKPKELPIRACLPRYTSRAPVFMDPRSRKGAPDEPGDSFVDGHERSTGNRYTDCGRARLMPVHSDRTPDQEERKAENEDQHWVAELNSYLVAHGSSVIRFRFVAPRPPCRPWSNLVPTSITSVYSILKIT